MSLASIPPLDLQTEHLDRSQYPTGRLLLLVAAVAGCGLLASWAAHRPAYIAGNTTTMQQGGERIAQASSIDREVASRLIPAEVMADRMPSTGSPDAVSAR